jgi:tRNA threonylcarbamoyl adenosine modification protein YeaZ
VLVQSEQRHSSLPYMLCLESSGTTCSVSLVQGNTLLAELSLFTAYLHDAALAEASRFLCETYHLSFQELHAIAVSAGPGSFAAFAKALCFQAAPEEPAPRLIAVPTLQALAQAALPFATARNLYSPAERITACIASHKNLVYVQSFSFSIPHATVMPSSDIRLVPEDEIEQERDIKPEQILWCGPALINKHIEFSTLPELCTLRAGMIATVAMQFYEQQRFTAPDNFTPLYAQDFTPKTPSAR